MSYKNNEIYREYHKKYREEHREKLRLQQIEINKKLKEKYKHLKCITCKKKITQYSKSSNCRGCNNKITALLPTRRRKSSISKLSEKNPNWIGNKVGYCGLHNWVKRRLLKTKLCNDCKKVPPIDLANIDVYDRNLEHWEWLCRRCHMIKDGRLNKFILMTRNPRKKNPPPIF